MLAKEANGVDSSTIGFSRSDIMDTAWISLIMMESPVAPFTNMV